MAESRQFQYEPHAARSMDRLLVAEDDEGVRMLISTVLTRNGYAVDLAKNGLEAIDRIALADYKAILLDLNMPMANGLEVISYLELTAPERLAESVIVITAVSNSELRKLDGKPIFRIMRKPFDLDDLLSTVAMVVRRGGNGDGRDGDWRGGDGGTKTGGDGDGGGDGFGGRRGIRRREDGDGDGDGDGDPETGGRSRWQKTGGRMTSAHIDQYPNRRSTCSETSRGSLKCVPPNVLLASNR